MRSLAGVVGDHQAAAVSAETGEDSREHPAASSSTSSFTAMRMAWKTRVAGLPRRRRCRGDGPGDDLGQLGRRRDGTGRLDRPGDAAGQAALPAGPEPRREDRGIGLVHDLEGARGLAWGPSACRAGRRGGRRSPAPPGRAATSSLRGRRGPLRGSGRWRPRRTRASAPDRRPKLHRPLRGGRRSGRARGRPGRRKAPDGPGRDSKQPGDRGRYRSGPGRGCAVRSGGGVAASSHRRIEDDPGGDGGQKRDDLVDHDRLVFVVPGPSAAPRRAR